MGIIIYCKSCHVTFVRNPCPSCGRIIEEEVKQNSGDRVIPPSQRFKRKEEIAERTLRPSDVAKANSHDENDLVKPSNVIREKNKGQGNEVPISRTISPNEMPSMSVSERIKERQGGEEDGENKEVYIKKVKSTLQEVVTLLERLIDEE